MMPKPKQSKSNNNFKKEVDKHSSERILYESQPNMLLYSDNFIFKIILLFVLVFMFSPILTLVYRIQGSLQSNYQLQFVNMTYIAELMLFLCIIIIVVKLILDYLDWKNTIYTLTDKRIIIKRGLFNKEKISMPYIKVQDIDVSQSVLERMMGTGDIVIYGGHDNVETILDEVPNPREVEEIILNQVNKLNYSYNQGQAPHAYNGFENYNDNQGNMQNNYDNSMNTPGYNRGYNPSNNHNNTGHNSRNNEYVKANNYNRAGNEGYNQADDGYFEEYESDLRSNNHASGNNSNTHYFNTEDTPKYSGIKQVNNDKKTDKSTSKLNKDELLSLNKRKFKKS
ncbi:MAG: hypothetical protein BZ137_07440 [Methanosphaera sp. rholeuAM130]|nr:MAG: hypothetical protein BZ137_07440 [Methanosphaera sp. rholeuAM130]